MNKEFHSKNSLSSKSRDAIMKELKAWKLESAAVAASSSGSLVGEPPSRARHVHKTAPCTRVNEEKHMKTQAGAVHGRPVLDRNHDDNDDGDDTIVHEDSDHVLPCTTSLPSSSSSSSSSCSTSSSLSSAAVAAAPLKFKKRQPVWMKKVKKRNPQALVDSVDETSDAMVTPLKQSQTKPRTKQPSRPHLLDETVDQNIVHRSNQKTVSLKKEKHPVNHPRSQDDADHVDYGDKLMEHDDHRRGSNKRNSRRSSSSVKDNADDGFSPRSSCSAHHARHLQQYEL